MDVKLKSSIAIRIHKEISLKKKDVITGKRGDGSEILRNVKSNWHKKGNFVDIKVGTFEYPDWVLEVGMIRTLLEKETVVIVGKIPRAKKTAKPKVKTEVEVKTQPKAKPKAKAKKTELPD